MSDRLDELVGHLREAEAPLDDLRRARILQRIERALDDGGGEEVVRPPRRGARWAAGGVLMALAAAAWLLWPRATPVAPTAILRPYVHAGVDTSGELLTRDHDRLELPAGAVVRAELGEAGRLTLRGPAKLRVVSAGASIELLLDEGALAVDFDASQGKRLLVRAPDGVTEVTGTLFAVEVAGGRSQVAVRRGAVKVHAGGRVQAVASGEAWRPGDLAVGPAPRETVARLVDHDASLLPPRGEWGVVLVTGGTAEVTQDARGVGPAPVAVRLPAGRTALEVSGIEVPAEVTSGETLPVAVPAPTLPVRQPAVPREVAPPAAPREVAPPAAPRDVAPPAAPREVAPPAAPREVAPPAAPREVAPPAEPREVAPPAEPTAHDLYTDAESAMRERRPQAARDALRRLVERHPADRLVETAHYELARLAFAAGEWSAAAEHLVRDPRDPALVEPVAYLRCRVAVARQTADAPARLAAFRRAFPRSPHDAEILALLAAARHRQGCTAAAPLLDEYLARYPTGPFASEARTARDRCR